MGNGMMEYQDGTFSKPEDLKSLIEKISKDSCILRNVKIIHIGTSAEELDGIKEIRNNENDIETRLAMISSHIEGIELDVNKILIHLGLDDKSKILPVR